MPLYDYRCVQGHVTELLRSAGVTTERCPGCNLPAQRVPVNRVAVQVTDVYGLGGTRLSVPRSGLDTESAETRQHFRRFQEATQEIDHAYSKHEESVGHPVQGPNLWEQSQAGARQMIAAGEAPPLATKG